VNETLGHLTAKSKAAGPYEQVFPNSTFAGREDVPSVAVLLARRRHVAKVPFLAYFRTFSNKSIGQHFRQGLFKVSGEGSGGLGGEMAELGNLTEHFDQRRDLHTGHARLR